MAVTWIITKELPYDGGFWQQPASFCYRVLRYCSWRSAYEAEQERQRQVQERMARQTAEMEGKLIRSPWE